MSPSPAHGRCSMAASAAERKAARSSGASPPANLEIRTSGSASSGIDMDDGPRMWEVEPSIERRFGLAGGAPRGSAAGRSRSTAESKVDARHDSAPNPLRRRGHRRTHQLQLGESDFRIRLILDGQHEITGPEPFATY